jgi:hypothetical protein
MPKDKMERGGKNIGLISMVICSTSCYLYTSGVCLCSCKCSRLGKTSASLEELILLDFEKAFEMNLHNINMEMTDLQ